MVLVWRLLGIVFFLRRKRKVGLKGLLEGSMPVQPSRAPALPPQARKTKQGCKPMLLGAKQAGNPESDVRFIFSFIEKRPGKCPEPLWCGFKTCFLVSKENV